MKLHTLLFVLLLFSVSFSGNLSPVKYTLPKRVEAKNSSSIEMEVQYLFERMKLSQGDLIFIQNQVLINKLEQEPVDQFLTEHYIDLHYYEPKASKRKRD